MKGRCVICGSIGRLSRDHVPPRGATPAQPLDVRRLLELAGGQNDLGRSRRRAFQAPSFSTLCKPCNVDRLGSEYDPSLIAFARAVTTWVRTATKGALSLPKSAEVDVNPQRVGRAVVGHLLAAEERSDPVAPLTAGTTTDAMRAYFLGTDTGSPPFRLFVWPYAATDIVIVRGMGLVRVLGRTHGVVVGDVLKFFPLAFWLVGTAPENVEFPFAELPLMESGTAALRIPLQRIPPARWPELPGKEEIVLSSHGRTHVATPQSEDRRG